MLVQFLVLPLFISQTYSAPQISFACIFGCSHSVDSPTHARIAIDPIPNSFHDDCEGQLNLVPSKQYKKVELKNHIILCTGSSKNYVDIIFGLFRLPTHLWLTF